MKDPHKFPKVLSGVMVGIMVLFAGAGGLSYAAYGKDIQVSNDSLSEIEQPRAATDVSVTFP